MGSTNTRGQQQNQSVQSLQMSGSIFAQYAFNTHAIRIIFVMCLYLRHQAFRSEQSRHGWKAINSFSL